ncbi:MAG: periplasmic heavy metal sensor [Proteobacteria bacterium]|nr:periplasmic heavy metal sensor [Pseudomonadota bacterium]
MTAFVKHHAFKLALAVSVTLNLLFVGVYAGHLGAPEGPGRPPLAEMVRKHKMDPAVREKIMKLMQQNKTQVVAARDAYKKSHDVVLDMLKQPEVDPVKLAAALNDARSRLTDVQAILHTMLLQAVPELSVEERLALVRKQGRLLKMTGEMCHHRPPHAPGESKEPPLQPIEGDVPPPPVE